ncbi:sensor histidine kinase [Tunturiibacter gelidoferens]|uniref:Two-component system sensor histidine kinase DesK n=1 Tax=Tunturiibacter gelidiferens TaxID=3069689 RepID=A0ACC5P198_9BACT|nr:sensor histidine kinase [Edaphobacter lichenicola]MBB5340505.1 two-component system sensor histidine kinase DesK [Edaphobacter lichenicola]
MTGNDNISSRRENKWPWIWLAYTGFLFIDPIMEPSRHIWLGTIAVFVTFLTIFFGYVRETDAGRPLRFWMIGATFLLGLVTFPWNSGGITFFVYVAGFLPFSIQSKNRVLALFFAESLAILGETYLFRVPGPLHIGWPNAIIGIFLLVIIGGGNIFFAEQKRAECKLRAAQEENVALAAVAERERIARDLHDVLGHTLSVIVLKAELVGRLIESDPQRAVREIADVETTARTALSEVREAIGGYRSQGLTAEMERTRKTLQSAGVALSCESPVPQLNASEETVLCLTVREAVTNIVRHAKATQCRIRFARSEDGYHSLLITDDGAQPRIREGNGLRGMRERVQSLGGRLSITTSPGVAILIELPHTTDTQNDLTPSTDSSEIKAPFVTT